jgi:hypothetical protein
VAGNKPSGLEKNEDELTSGMFGRVFSFKLTDVSDMPNFSVIRAATITA